MTDHRDAKFWKAMADEMQRALQLGPLSDEEARQEYEQASEAMPPDLNVEECVRIAMSGIPREPSFVDRISGRPTSKEIDQEVDEVIGMHRNEGEMDPEVEEEMRRRREEALEDEEDPDADGKADQET